MLLSSDPPKDGFAGANRRPEFIRRGGTSEKRNSRSSFSTFYFVISNLSAKAQRAFTLLELLVVIGIIAILMVLIVPAFTNIKSGSDVTSAAYTIKGVLDTACTYAKTNNTYTWVGFFEENVASTTPGTGGVGRLVMSIVASNDGTNVASSSATWIPTNLIQVGKLTKIDNVHLAAFPDATATPPPISFDTRPAVTFSGTQYSLANMPDSSTPILYPLAGTAQYTFKKVVQFGSDGEARIENNTFSPYSAQTVAEIGIEPTHGNVVPSSTPANVFAIQFGGIGGNVTIYRR
jgi:prepilin-type N-terminal cleavage/methylation domain-containing protein